MACPGVESSREVLCSSDIPAGVKDTRWWEAVYMCWAEKMGYIEVLSKLMSNKEVY